MTKSIYFAVLLALFAAICYVTPQAIEKSFANTDNLVRIHKSEYTNQKTK